MLRGWGWERGRDPITVTPLSTTISAGWIKSSLEGPRLIPPSGSHIPSLFRSRFNLPPEIHLYQFVTFGCFIIWSNQPLPPEGSHLDYYIFFKRFFFSGQVHESMLDFKEGFPCLSFFSFLNFPSCCFPHSMAAITWQKSPDIHDLSPAEIAK